MLYNNFKKLLLHKSMNIDFLSVHFGLDANFLSYLESAETLDDINIGDLSTVASYLDVPVTSMYTDVKYKIFIKKYNDELLAIADTKKEAFDIFQNYIMDNLSLLYDTNNNAHLRVGSCIINIHTYINGKFHSEVMSRNINWQYEYLCNVFNILNIKNKNVIIKFLINRYPKERVDLINRLLTDIALRGLHTTHDVSSFINQKYHLSNFIDYLENYVAFCEGRYIGNLVML